MDAPPPEKPPRMYEGPPPGSPQASQAAGSSRKKPRYTPPPSPLVTLGLPFLILLGIVLYFRLQPEGAALPAALEPLAEVWDRAVGVAEQAKGRFVPGTERPANGRPLGARPRRRSAAKRPKAKLDATVSETVVKNQVTLSLANGNRITGELIRETPEQVVILWGGGEVTFDRQKEVRGLIRHPDPPEPAAPAP